MSAIPVLAAALFSASAALAILVFVDAAIRITAYRKAR